MLPYSLVNVKPELPTWPFLLGLGMWLCFFPWCLAGVGWLLFRRFLCAKFLTFPGPLATESDPFLGLFYLLPMAFPGRWLLQHPV